MVRKMALLTNGRIVIVSVATFLIVLICFVSLRGDSVESIRHLKDHAQNAAQNAAEKYDIPRFLAPSLTCFLRALPCILSHPQLLRAGDKARFCEAHSQRYHLSPV